MMRLGHFFIVVFLTCAVVLISPVMADDIISAQTMFANFERPDIFRTRYNEERHVPALAEPLRSEGDFIYIKGEGIAWLMEKPFSMQTVMHENGLTQWINGDIQEKNANTNRMLDPVIQNIFAIFSGDVQGITESFDISIVDAADHAKSIRLTPKSSNMQQYMQGIIISGHDYVERVRISYDEDRYTVINYSKPQVGRSFITDKEGDLFDIAAER